MESHCFNVSIAAKIGVKNTIVLTHIKYWVDRNALNGKNFHKGSYWTYNSKRAFAGVFPYFTEKQIKSILTSLKNSGYIEVDRFNENKYDHTIWYTVTDAGNLLFGESTKNNDKIGHTDHSDRLDQMGQSIGPNGPIERTKWSNRTDQMGQPIPDINKYKTNKESKPKKVSEKIDFSDRTKVFKESLFKFCKSKGGDYDEDVVSDFFNYWSEPNKSKTKMRFEMEKTWETSRRLKTWFKRSKEKSCAKKESSQLPKRLTYSSFDK